MKFKIFLLLFIANTAYAYIDIDPNNKKLQGAIHANQQELSRLINFLNQKKQANTFSWSQLYYEVMPSLIQKFNLSIGCEVGVAYGGNSENMLQKTNLVKLYSIDPYHHFSAQEYPDGMNFEQKAHDLLYLMTKNRLEKFGDRSELIRKKSVEAAADFENKSLDFVFLDGNHTYKGAKEDISAWWPKVRPGGLIIGDDYYDAPSAVVGVMPAVKEFVKEHNLEVHRSGTGGRIWWCIKPQK